ncbi:MAG: M14 family zinc carboxypeptidase [Planctomycetota bacterium]|jgi:hypothetical protein
MKWFQRMSINFVFICIVVGALTPVSYAKPTPAKYHSHDEVIVELLALEASGVAKTYIIGNTHEGRDIWAVKISDNPSEDEEEPGALFFGCEHAGEWIAIEVPLYIAQYLVDNYYSDQDITYLVDSCEIWIVPVMNPDGYEYSRTTDRMWQKNRRDNGDGTFGVSLNRNWDYMWGGAGSSGTTSSGAYRGPSPFSEPETQAIRDLVLAHDFRFLMNYHSPGQMIWSPGYILEPCADDIPMSTMKLTMRNLIKETSGAIYIDWWDWPGASAASASGDATEWAYGVLGIYSFGIELGPFGSRIPPVNLIRTICEENLPVALYLISFAAADYGIENQTTGKTYSNIQLAINDANDGDEIVVDSGVYHENISFIDKNLTLRSTDPNAPSVVASTVINIEDLYQGSVITLSRSSDGVCVLAGLTITGGTVGISCCDASPTIINCTIESNGPNAIEFWEGYEPTIIDCNILGQVVEVNDPTLVAHWALDETQGNIAHDSAGAHDGTCHGEPLWQPTAGRIDGALAFDGIDDYVSTPFVLDPADGPFSVFAWVKGGAPGQVVISQGDGVNWLLADPAEGKLMTDLKSGRRSARPLNSQATITDGEWHRVGFVWDGSNRILYVDDIEVAKDLQEQLAGSTGGLYVGVDRTLDAGSFFSGLIDDVRIYDRAVAP